jgi:hypothetical protein
VAPVVPHRLAAVVAALGLLTVTSGCSWLSMGPVPERPPAGGKLDCKESQTAPAADVVGAVVSGVPAGFLLFSGVALALDKPSCSSDGDGLCLDFRGVGYLFMGVAVVGLGIATLYALSARHGYRHAARCAELRRPGLSWLPAPSKLPREPPPELGSDDVIP